MGGKKKMRRLISKIALSSCALAFIAFANVNSVYADGIVFLQPNQLRPDGVGLRTVLSLQSPGRSSTESGGVRYDGTQDVTFGDAIRGGTNNTVSFAELGITQASELLIGFNINEPSGGPGSDPVTVTALTLTAYDANGNAVFTANLLQSTTLQQIGNGQGTADYLFTLDQEAAARLAAVFDPNLRLGLSATITNAQGGPESFFFDIGRSSVPNEPIPEPATMLLLSTGLAGIAAKVRRRRKSSEE